MKAIQAKIAKNKNVGPGGLDVSELNTEDHKTFLTQGKDEQG